MLSWATRATLHASPSPLLVPFQPTQRDPHLAVAGLEDLLGEVLVDHRGLQAEAVGGVDVVGRVVSRGRGVDGSLVDGQVVQLARLTLVEEQGAVDLTSTAATITILQR